MPLVPLLSLAVPVLLCLVLPFEYLNFRLVGKLIKLIGNREHRKERWVMGDGRWVVVIVDGEIEDG